MAQTKNAPEGAANRGEPAKGTDGAVQGGGAGAGGGGAAEDYDQDPQGGGGDMRQKPARHAPDTGSDGSTGGMR